MPVSFANATLAHPDLVGRDGRQDLPHFWLYPLLAAPLVKAAPGNSEIRLHAAFIYAAVNDWTGADRELKAALKLSPELAKRDDVAQLQTRIAKAGPSK